MHTRISYTSSIIYIYIHIHISYILSCITNRQPEKKTTVVCLFAWPQNTSAYSAGHNLTVVQCIHVLCMYIYIYIYTHITGDVFHLNGEPKWSQVL